MIGQSRFGLVGASSRVSGRGDAGISLKPRPPRALAGIASIRTSVHQVSTKMHRLTHVHGDEGTS
jgi:hypothetical protein